MSNIAVGNEKNILFYTDENGMPKVEVILRDENVWLNVNAIATLFAVQRPAIVKHISNIYNDKELSKESTCSILEQVQIEGNRSVKRKKEYYNLDMIISIGFRVNSKKAIKFRTWATKILKEYMIKGAVIDEERLKNPNYLFGDDYFDEILEKIKNIRSSERRFYQKITDIYSQCSIDYDKDSDITKDFFKTVQNKLHYSVTGNTAAEIIYNRARSSKKHMGLTNWKHSPEGPIYKYDVDIAKNYLSEKELKDLNRIVSMYLDYDEMQAENHNAMTVKDWVEKLNVFLSFNGKEILRGAGKISSEVAKALAYKEYDKYQKELDKKYISDFDKFISQVKQIENNNN